MSKLSFRAKALDCSKPMPIYLADELPDLPDYSAINRAVPQMPSGMEKEEECEHHLQRAICAGLIIPTPEVTELPDEEFFERVYPANYKQPRQLIHMQPFALEQDKPDYDVDSEDEMWLELQSQAQRLELNHSKFEEMMDILEKSSGSTVVTLAEAIILLKENKDLSIAVFDYWLNKRLKSHYPLIPSVKTEHRTGTAPSNPYIAFRRRTEKMQTRKNRKNDESSYEKMLKLRRDLCRTLTLLSLVKEREKIKHDYVKITSRVFEKQYEARDFNGIITAEASASKTTARPAFTPIFHNHYSNQSWVNRSVLKEEVIQRKEKRQYKKRKHKSLLHGPSGLIGVDCSSVLSSDDEQIMHLSPEGEETEDEGQFVFRRNKMCSYHLPLSSEGNWPWCSNEENGSANKRYRFALTSLSNPSRCIGFARRRVGRGGRIILDRVSSEYDDFWRTVDFSVIQPEQDRKSDVDAIKDSADSDLLTNSDNVDCTDVKFDLNYFNNNENRTGISDVGSEFESVKREIKQEPEDTIEHTPSLESTKQDEKVLSRQENSEMVELLRSMRRDWLHFKPKTPPPEYELPCPMLQPSDNILNLSANVPFSVEVQPLDNTNTFLDNSAFTTDPFIFDSIHSVDVPVTDTRQMEDFQVQTGINLNVNVGLNTLTSSVMDSSNINLNDSLLYGSYDLEVSNSERSIGCSWFNILEESVKRREVARTSIPKCSSVESDCTFSLCDKKEFSSDCSFSNANGLLSQFGIDVPPDTMKTSKACYAYPSGVEYSYASSDSLSLHTSAHPLTLNSHSANVFEIPTSNEAEAATNKLVTSPFKSAGAGPNNKNKSIVQKNNLVMEVT